MGNTVLDDVEKSTKLISFGASIVGAYSVAACKQECVQHDVTGGVSIRKKTLFK